MYALSAVPVKVVGAMNVLSVGISLNRDCDALCFLQVRRRDSQHKVVIERWKKDD